MRYVIVLLKVKVKVWHLGILLFMLYGTCSQIMSTPTLTATAFLKFN